MHDDAGMMKTQRKTFCKDNITKFKQFFDSLESPNPFFGILDSIIPTL